MKTVFYYNGNKIARKELNELVGKSVVKELVFLSKERRFMRLVLESSFNMGSYGTVTVCFE